MKNSNLDLLACPICHESLKLEGKALLICMKWTTVYFALFAPLILVRAWCEETALTAEFGEQWWNDRRRVPMLVLHMRKESHV